MPVCNIGSIEKRQEPKLTRARVLLPSCLCPDICPSVPNSPPQKAAKNIDYKSLSYLNIKFIDN